MSRCIKHPNWGDSTCLPCLEEADAVELATLRARVDELEAALAVQGYANAQFCLRVAKLEPIVELAAKWYLVPGGGSESLHALQDLESALHIYLELT